MIATDQVAVVMALTAIAISLFTIVWAQIARRNARQARARRDSERWPP